MLLYNGLHATIDYRIAHWFYRHRCFFIARAISQWSKMWTGIEIHPGATIGRRLVIDHGTGIVIGETAEIGDDCLLYQGVTLGGTGKDIGKRHPTLGNNVMVGSGAKVLGPFRVGDNARIAANAVVLREVLERRSSAFRAGSSGSAAISSTISTHPTRSCWKSKNSSAAWRCWKNRSTIRKRRLDDVSLQLCYTQKGRICPL